VRAGRGLTGILERALCAGEEREKGEDGEDDGWGQAARKREGGGAAWAGAEGARPGWLLGRGEKRGEGKEEVGFENNSIQFEFKWDLNSNSTIQTNKIDAPA
jgi:hypothetical protein